MKGHLCKTKLLLRCGDVHPNPGPRALGRFGIWTLNVGGPHISEKRWNGLLHELADTGLKVIALQEVSFRKGAAWRGPKTEQILPNYKLLTAKTLVHPMSVS